MSLRKLSDLINLRRFLFDAQNGYSALSRDKTKGLNQKISEIDNMIIGEVLNNKNLLSEEDELMLGPSVVPVTENVLSRTKIVSSDPEAYAESIKMIGQNVDVRNGVPEVQSGVLVISPPAPLDEQVKTDTPPESQVDGVIQQNVDKIAKKSKKTSFSRSE